MTTYRIAYINGDTIGAPTCVEYITATDNMAAMAQLTQANPDAIILSVSNIQA